MLEVYNLNKIKTTTINLDTIVFVQNNDIIDIKNLLIKNGIFCKIFPCPKNILENCVPVIVVSSIDELVTKKILNKNNVSYELIKMKKDIVGELLEK